jgi:hypothetical protein
MFSLRPILSTKIYTYIAKKTDILLENNCKNECLIGLGICQVGLQGLKA